MRTSSLVLVSLILVLAAHASADSADDLAAVQGQAGQWRAERRVIDMHMHIDPA